MILYPGPILLTINDSFLKPRSTIILLSQVVPQSSFLDFAQPLGLQDNTIQQPAGPRFLSTIKKKNWFQNLQALVLKDDRA